MEPIPIQDGREIEKKQNGLGVGNEGDPMYTIDTTGAQSVAYEIPEDEPFLFDGKREGDFRVYAEYAPTLPARMGTGGNNVPFVAIPCQVDGSPVAATLRGFGHGWQGQHNSTNAVVQIQSWGYDEYNDSITEELHHSLRAGTRQSNGVLHLFEPMSMREENWAESDVKNALRAGASKSSHAIVELPASFSAGNSAKAYGIGLTENGTPPLRAGASGTNQVPTVLYDMEEEEMAENLVVRRLTPVECEKLMGWDPNWTQTGINEETGEEVKMADTHRYKMCGNGVVANVSYWFGVRYEQAKGAADDANPTV